MLIIGRVVIRIRREQFNTSIKSTGHDTPGLSSALGTAPDTDVSQFLQPNQKSVHAIRSRAGLFFNMIGQTRTTVSTSWQHWRQRRHEAATLSPAPEPSTPIREDTSVTGKLDTTGETASRWDTLRHRDTVNAPARSRLGSLRSRVRLFRSSPAAEATVPEVADTDVPAVTPAPRFRLVSKEKKEEQVGTSPAGSAEKPEEQGITPAEKQVIAVESTPSSPTVKQQFAEKGFAKSLLKRARIKAPPLIGPLREAVAAISSQNYQQAEDVLVPYIVKHPKDTGAYMLLGRAALGKESWADAMEIFEQVVKWNRAEEGAYAGLGYAAYRAGRFTRALEALQRAYEADPHDEAVLDHLLSIAEKLDNPALQHSIHEKMEALALEKAQHAAQAQTTA